MKAARPRTDFVNATTPRGLEAHYWARSPPSLSPGPPQQPQDIPRGSSQGPHLKSHKQQKSNPNSTQVLLNGGQAQQYQKLNKVNENPWGNERNRPNLEMGTKASAPHAANGVGIDSMEKSNQTSRQVSSSNARFHSHSRAIGFQNNSSIRNSEVLRSPTMNEPVGATGCHGQRHQPFPAAGPRHALSGKVDNASSRNDRPVSVNTNLEKPRQKIGGGTNAQRQTMSGRGSDDVRDSGSTPAVTGISQHRQSQPPRVKAARNDPASNHVSARQPRLCDSDNRAAESVTSSTRGNPRTYTDKSSPYPPNQDYAASSRAHVNGAATDLRQTLIYRGQMFEIEELFARQERLSRDFYDLTQNEQQELPYLNKLLKPYEKHHRGTNPQTSKDKSTQRPTQYRTAQDRVLPTRNDVNGSPVFASGPPGTPRVRPDTNNHPRFRQTKPPQSAVGTRNGSRAGQGIESRNSLKRKASHIDLTSDTEDSSLTSSRPKKVCQDRNQNNDIGMFDHTALPESASQVPALHCDTSRNVQAPAPPSTTPRLNGGAPHNNEFPNLASVAPRQFPRPSSADDLEVDLSSDENGPSQGHPQGLLPPFVPLDATIWVFSKETGESYLCLAGATDPAERENMSINAAELALITAYQAQEEEMVDSTLKNIEIAVYNKRVGYKKGTVGFNAEGQAKSLKAANQRPKMNPRQNISNTKGHTNSAEQMRRDRRPYNKATPLEPTTRIDPVVLDDGFQQPTANPRVQTLMHGRHDHPAASQVPSRQAPNRDIAIPRPSPRINPTALNEDFQSALNGDQPPAPENGVKRRSPHQPFQGAQVFNENAAMTRPKSSFDPALQGNGFPQPEHGSQLRPSPTQSRHSSATPISTTKKRMSDRQAMPPPNLKVTPHKGVAPAGISVPTLLSPFALPTSSMSNRDSLAGMSRAELDALGKEAEKDCPQLYLPTLEDLGGSSAQAMKHKLSDVGVTNNGPLFGPRNNEEPADVQPSSVGAPTQLDTGFDTAFSMRVPSMTDHNPGSTHFHQTASSLQQNTPHDPVGQPPATKGANSHKTRNTTQQALYPAFATLPDDPHSQGFSQAVPELNNSQINNDNNHTEQMSNGKMSPNSQMQQTYDNIMDDPTVPGGSNDYLNSQSPVFGGDLPDVDMSTPLDLEEHFPGEYAAWQYPPNLEEKFMQPPPTHREPDYRGM